MPRHSAFLPHGVIPAVLLPFNEDLAIDEASYRAHLRDVAAVQGISAITTNAHSTEVASCSFDEQARVLAITADEIGARACPLSEVSMPTAAWKRCAWRKWPTPAAPRPCWCFPPPFTRSASAPKWRSIISAASRRSPICR